MASVPTNGKRLLSFDIDTQSHGGPRIGRLSFPGKATMLTPNFVPASSRGAIPHISQDMMRDHTPIKSMYTAIEDYIEKAPSETPPVYDFPATQDESPLRKFIALQRDALLILGPRRIPPLPCPSSSTSTSIGVVTAFGFSMLECGEYVRAVQKLRPDIALAMGDVLYGLQPGVKRAERMGDRTQSWLNALIAGMDDPAEGAPNTALFAPILPLEAEKQTWYLAALESDFGNRVSGLVLHAIESVDAIPKALSPLPRMWMGGITDPHQLLDAVAAGIDFLTIPFVNETSEAGIALKFSFGNLSDAANEGSKPLAFDMWSNAHATDLSPLQEDCTCYTCTDHHRAYVHHLLNTKEMLSWVLLQLHNYQVLRAFFAAVRQSIERGTFEMDKAAFSKAYERSLPEKTGQGPRIRGYQTKSEGRGEPKKNPKPYHALNDQREKVAEAVPPSPMADAVDLEQVGFAEMFGGHEP